jgi:hypothetical protein
VFCIVSLLMQQPLYGFHFCCPSANLKARIKELAGGIFTTESNLKYKGYNLQRIGLWDNQRLRIAKKLIDQQYFSIFPTIHICNMDEHSFIIIILLNRTFSEIYSDVNLFFIQTRQNS